MLRLQSCWRGWLRRRLRAASRSAAAAVLHWEQRSLLRSLRAKVVEETRRSAQLRSSLEANGFALRLLGDEMRRLQRFEDGDEALRLRRLDGLPATTKVKKTHSVLLRHVGTEPWASAAPLVVSAGVQTEQPSEPSEPSEPLEAVKEVEILEESCEESFEESFEELDDATWRRLEEIAESMAEMASVEASVGESEASGLYITLLAQRGALGFKLTPGLLVYRTQPGSWAEAAGLRHGDVLLKVSNLEARSLTLGLSVLFSGVHVISCHFMGFHGIVSCDFVMF